MDAELFNLNRTKQSVEQEINILRQTVHQMEKEADELWLNIQTNHFNFVVLEKAIKEFTQKSQQDISTLKSQLKRTHTNHKKTAQSIREQQNKTKQSDEAMFQELTDQFVALQRDNQLLLQIIVSLAHSHRIPCDVPRINNIVVKESFDIIEEKLLNHDKLVSDFEMLSFLLWRRTSSSTSLKNHLTSSETKEDERESIESIESNNQLEGDEKSSRSESEEAVNSRSSTNGCFTDQRTNHQE